VAGSPEAFHRLVEERLRVIGEENKDAFLRLEEHSSRQKNYKQYTRVISQLVKNNDKKVLIGYDERSRPLVESLKKAYKERGVLSLDSELKHHYYGYVLAPLVSKISKQRNHTDLQYPTEWYAGTREMTREIHLHVGPTNSGKTYHALKRLEQAKSGIYGGPLRLLAHEVYTRMNAKGLDCGLVTGEERRLPDHRSDFPNLMSCTVEMIPLSADVEVAVLDEIQMIGDEHRGWAWTQALLGVQAKELHLCGEERTVPLIQELAATMGDRLHIHRYQRLTPLAVQNTSLKGSWKNLQKGDAVIVFSILGIHNVRKQIEKHTGKKVAVVYGSLPPETRAQQARLFNDPDNDYDYLVASDAVGMGLNLYGPRSMFLHDLSNISIEASSE
jgi:ATP-dependent RNA helicase SUPV3L1/SUV3